MASDILVARRAGLIEAELNGELVGLHMDNNSCYGFNLTATRIWRLIEHPKQISEICATLIVEFRVTREECEKQVLALLTEMMREGLVELSTQPSTGAAGFIGDSGKT